MSVIALFRGEKNGKRFGMRSNIVVINVEITKMAIKINHLESEDINRIIEMAWEDRTPFEAIKMQFDVSEGEVINIMRRELKRSSFNLWRKRVNSGISQKHQMKRSNDISRFKSKAQRSISLNKISKR